MIFFYAITNPVIAPTGLGSGSGAEIIGRLLARIFAASLAIGAIAFLLYLVYGAFRWLTAGDDKTQLQTARGTMTQALIGLTILASIFAIARIVGILLGIENFPDVINWPTITGGSSCLGGGADCTSDPTVCCNSCIYTGSPVTGSYCN
jgi:hypothetical protein